MRSDIVIKFNSIAQYAGLLGLCAALSFVTPPSRATDVSLADLVRTCRHALADDYQGMAAAACDWYVEPCMVCAEPAPLVPVCEPPDLRPPVRAQAVLATIAQGAFDLALAVDKVLPEVLALTFPCHAQP